MMSAFPGRRRKTEMKHEKREGPAMEAKEMRDERMAKRPILKLKKRGK